MIYMGIIVLVMAAKHDSLFDLELNELGDFLAGAFGPIAFLWLVLGYIQQGAELRQGTEALLLQATELNSSVKQQAAIAEAQRISLINYDRSLEPLLALKFESYEFIEGDAYDLYSLTNMGAYCECLVINHLQGLDEFRAAGLHTLFKDESKKFYLQPSNDEQMTLLVRYKRSNGSEGAQGFVIGYHYDEDGYSVLVSKLPFVI